MRQEIVDLESGSKNMTRYLAGDEAGSSGSLTWWDSTPSLFYGNLNEIDRIDDGAAPSMLDVREPAVFVAFDQPIHHTYAFPIVVRSDSDAHLVLAMDIAHFGRPAGWRHTYLHAMLQCHFPVPGTAGVPIVAATKTYFRRNMPIYVVYAETFLCYAYTRRARSKKGFVVLEGNTEGQSVYVPVHILGLIERLKQLWVLLDDDSRPLSVPPEAVSGLDSFGHLRQFQSAYGRSERAVRKILKQRVATAVGILQIADHVLTEQTIPDVEINGIRVPIVPNAVGTSIAERVENGGLLNLNLVD
jgi:hypothetical protein